MNSKTSNTNNKQNSDKNTIIDTIVINKKSQSDMEILLDKNINNIIQMKQKRISNILKFADNVIVEGSRSNSKYRKTNKTKIQKYINI